MYKLFCIGCVLISFFAFGQSKIDRQKVVSRHNVFIHQADTLNALTLGNGSFAMTMDITGLQTFPEHYQKGIPLGTLSEWGWHSFPTDKKYQIEETLHPLASHGREVPYARQWPADTQAGKAANYIRQNPHRIHLATLGWHIQKSDGSLLTVADIENINQQLDLWNGVLISQFEVEGVSVEVVSVVSQRDDRVGIQIRSQLVKEGRIGLTINFPYPTDLFLDEAVHFDPEEPKRLKSDQPDKKHLSIHRSLDTTQYFTQISSSLNLQSPQVTQKGYLIKPDKGQETWTFIGSFSETENQSLHDSFDALKKQVNEDFNHFWITGGMIDFGETSDPRAKELERRMILSLYLTKVNCGGTSPPQETGLVYNSWYGKPHLEMTWWHGVHFALWNRPEMLEKHMEWYLRNSDVAKKIAERQGFSGIRWQKMTDNEGGETASSTGSYLIWQQPHFVYFAELIYRIRGQEALEKYKSLVEQTAEFMADFTWYDPELERYILGPGIIPAQERFDPVTTYNPAYELAYWRWGLEIAQQWRERLGQERKEKWDNVLDGLSPLPQKDGLYLAAESAPDSYTTLKYMTDHPSVLGTYGMLPATKGLDKEVMQCTFEKIWTDWQWHDTWGWDFPMTAMTATRLDEPEKAVQALLMPIATNTYLKNGHNYQTERLRLYLPGNGGFLIALAMMAVGTDETSMPLPGFPKGWKVKIEDLNKMP